MKPYLNLSLVLCLTLLGLAPAFSNDVFENIDAELVDRAVVMELPEGVRRVRLQIRNAQGIWETCTIAHLKGTEGYLKLRLPDGVHEEDLEVAASWTDPFPFEFYQGKSNFDPTQADGNTNRNAYPGGPELDATTGGEAVTVEESDIWKWRDNVLYFFNQYRGLQVIDVSDPATPERLANLRIPFSGEQLYLHPSEDFVVLLTYDGNSGNGEILLIEHTDTDVLEKRASFPVPGYIMESRMVGSILYVVSRQWWQESVIDDETKVEHIQWQSGLAVSKIDLTDPTNPVAADPLELRSDKYDYWGGQVQATPEVLLVSTNEYDSILRKTTSTVHVVDISDPAVDPVISHQVPVKGRVLNKFNLHYNEHILTVVSQVWRGEAERRRYASVETFDLSQTSAEPIEALAALEFANNESITATRFTGDLLYVVTFLRVDPLFVISLADPANPQMVGELEIPGFSTHLETFGENALISVGVEDSQIAVSWFDVSNPAEPTLASRVFVGAEDGWSWTEANWDEKAFGFFPDDGFILLPYSGYDPEGGWSSGVQIIEIGQQELIKRGSFEHEFQARRARVVQEAVVSISGRSLKSLDISDPDNPVLQADLTLAWPVDIVHRVGDYLIQLERGPGYWYYGGNDANARLHLSPVENDDERIDSLDLPGGRIVGSLLLDDCLVVAQATSESVLNEDEVWENSETFSLTVIGLDDPSAPEILGTASHVIFRIDNYYGFGADYDAQVLPDGKLVWYPAEQNYHYFLEPGIGGVDLRAADFRYPYYPSSGRIYTASIADKEQPQILSATGLLERENEGEVNYWPEGKPQLLGSVLYFGLQTSEYVELKEGSPQWMARHWLGQLDLSDAALPVRRELVKIPGSFENAIDNDSGGVVLFTSLFHSYYEKEFWRNELRIQALAFDGLQAFLIDELVDEDQGYGPKLFENQYIILGKTDYSTNEAVTDLTTHEWLSSGSFQELQTLQQPGAIYRLGIKDDLLFATGSSELNIIDFADPSDPARTTLTFPNVNFWQRIELIDIYQRESAYLPQGWYGVQTLDFEGAFGSESESFELPRMLADSTPEWVSIGVDLLTITRADNGLILGQLEEGEPWMFSESVEQLSYEDWMRQALQLGGDDTVPAGDEDSDGDGLSNGWEYFAGSHPGNAAGAVPVESWVSMGQDGNRYMHLRTQINLHAESNTTIVPQYSYDLENWMVLPESFEITEEAFNPARLVRYLAPVDSQDVVFVRLVLSSATK